MTARATTLDPAQIGHCQKMVYKRLGADETDRQLVRCDEPAAFEQFDVCEKHAQFLTGKGLPLPMNAGERFSKTETRKRLTEAAKLVRGVAQAGAKAPVTVAVPERLNYLSAPVEARWANADDEAAEFVTMDEASELTRVQGQGAVVFMQADGGSSDAFVAVWLGTDADAPELFAV